MTNMKKVIGLFAVIFVATIGSANAHGIIDTYARTSYDHTHISAIPYWHAPDAHQYYPKECHSRCGEYRSNVSYSSSYGYSSYGGKYKYTASSPHYVNPVYSNPGNLADPFIGISTTQRCAGCQKQLQEMAMRLRNLSQTASGREFEFDRLKGEYNRLWHEYQRITSRASLN